MRGYTLVFDALRSAALSMAASGARISTHLRDRLGDDHACADAPDLAAADVLTRPT